MILNYRDKKTERFASGAFVRAFQGFEEQAAKRLSILNAAPDLESLRARRVLLQHDPNYVETIAVALRDACAQARTAESEV